MSTKTKKTSSVVKSNPKFKLSPDYKSFKFDDIVRIYLENLYKFNESNNLELEIRFGTRNISNINKIDYINTIKSLIGQGFEILQDDIYLLRIQNEIIDEITNKKKFSNIRTEIKGLYNIENYCNNNNIISLLTNGHVEFTQKKYLNIEFKDEKIDIYPVNQDDYNFRISLQEENNLPESSEKIQELIQSWNENKKIFRFIKRAKLVHKDLPIIIDLSIVKTSKKNRQYYESEYDIKSAEVFTNPEIYEIEIEVDNNKVKNNEEFMTLTGLTQSIRKAIKYILCGLQQSNFPISYTEQESIAQEYLQLIKGSSFRDGLKLQSRDFIGPSSLTLQMQNIISLEVTQQSESIIPNIRNEYTVTDKADGLRKLLFINKTGFIYLITSNLTIEFTGYTCADESLFETILDGEHITKNKKNNPINLYAAFDIYYINKKNITSLAFIYTKSEEKSIDARFPILISFIKKIKYTTQFFPDIPFRIESKKFYAETESQSIFKACDIILNNVEEGLIEYETDGLIFTPQKFSVGGDSIGNNAPEFKTTWIHSLKWKPPQWNTIDFLVTFNKTPSGLPIIKNIFNKGIDLSKDSQLASYQVITLRVGYDEKKHGYINPCENLINNKFPDKSDIDNNDSYKPVQFYPTNPTDYNAGIANIMLQKNKLDNLSMFTEENEIIEDYTIVEFRYDHTRDEFWRWVPIRIRVDKTAEFRSGQKNFGNAYHVANSNWHTIHNPITETIIRTGENIPFQIGDDDIYYNKIENRKTITRALRDFHNLFVKNLLIKSISKPGDTLIDYAVGKAGDLSKWNGAKLSFVLGIDISRDNIENRLDGACARYLNYYKKFDQIPKALFIQGNSSINIRNGNALLTEKGKQIIKVIFGEGPKDEKLLGTGVYNNYGIAKDGFNISSIQFAIHYIFENLLTFNNFLKNLAECTMLNGYFIGTSYDGQTIFNELKEKEKQESLNIFEDDKKIWEITKQYDNITFENNNSCLGLGIDVYQSSINKTFREYLVNYDYLVRMLENYGFVPLSKEEYSELNLPNSIGSFNQLFIKMQDDIKKDKKLKTAFGQAPYMNDKERTISFLNKYFIFKKIRQVDSELVFRENINSQSLQEPIDIPLTKQAQQVLSQEQLILASPTKSKVSKKDTQLSSKQSIVINPLAETAEIITPLTIDPDLKKSDSEKIKIKAKKLSTKKSSS